MTDMREQVENAVVGLAAGFAEKSGMPAEEVGIFASQIMLITANYCKALSEGVERVERGILFQPRQQRAE